MRKSELHDLSRVRKRAVRGDVMARMTRIKTAAVLCIFTAMGVCLSYCGGGGGAVNPPRPTPAPRPSPSPTWITNAAMPTARYGLAAGVIGSILYAVGGSNITGDLSTVEAYDPSTNT